jgi:hypothetical protein
MQRLVPWPRHMDPQGNSPRNGVMRRAVVNAVSLHPRGCVRGAGARTFGALGIDGSMACSRSSADAPTAASVARGVFTSSGARESSRAIRSQALLRASHGQATPLTDCSKGAVRAGHQQSHPLAIAASGRAPGVESRWFGRLGAYCGERRGEDEGMHCVRHEVSMSRILVLALCASAFACGGSSTGTTTPDGISTSSSGGNGSSSGGTSSGSSRSSESSSGSGGSSGSSGSSGGAEVPINHRPTGATCPQQRGPGMLPTQCSYDAGPPPACLRDSDCTQGNNGRCLHPDLTPPVCEVACSYDQCFTDSDCPAMEPCDCRPSATSSVANVCFGGSHCRIDSDCGPGGYCSPSEGYGAFNCYVAYFCHTPADTCVNDTDCDSGKCQYDSTAAHWRCGGPMCAPPP